MKSVVLTLIGSDRSGLVESLAETVAEHDGSWLESRMARLAGKFAGVLRVTVPREREEALVKALRQLDSAGLTIVVEAATDSSAEPPARRVQLELVGNDRVGIVREISRLLARGKVNVEDLTTQRDSAPMSGNPLFKAWATLQLPSQLTVEELRSSLEDLENDLMVDIKLEGEAG